MSAAVAAVQAEAAAEARRLGVGGPLVAEALLEHAAVVLAIELEDFAKSGGTIRAEGLEPEQLAVESGSVEGSFEPQAREVQRAPPSQALELVYIRKVNPN